MVLRQTSLRKIIHALSSAILPGQLRYPPTPHPELTAGATWLRTSYALSGTEKGCGALSGYAYGAMGCAVLPQGPTL
eukprot:1601422-Rhodomonas_salina.1